jgi:hypothetical protein
LASQPAHRFLHGRAKTMNHEIRQSQYFFNPLTLALSRRERGLKPLLRKS